MGIPDLIESLTPLYNHYKQNQKELSGTDSLLLMWEIGDILKSYITKNDVAPHTLFRMVYGKSEGANHIKQKSYITREFQGRCYRIRNIFDNKEDIQSTLPSLKHFTLFREAMPFFDNERYQLSSEKKKELLKVLNTTSDYAKAAAYIKNLQNTHIQKSNPRTQRLDDLENEKQAFIEIYNYVFKLLTESGSNEINRYGIPTTGEIRLLANNTNALSQDGLKFRDGALSSSLSNSVWINYFQVLEQFKDQSNAKILRRFRRIIPPERIVRLADMLFELSKK